MFQPRVIVMVLLVGFGLFFLANVDTTPDHNSAGYSSSAWVAPAAPMTAPVNPETVPDAPKSESTEQDESESVDETTDDEGNAAPAIGDDNGDGTIDEDESGWDCETMGNGECGTVKRA